MNFKLDWTQFCTLLQHLNKTDWWPVGLSVLAQFLVACIALLGGYFFQKRFNEIEKKFTKRKETYRFNEAIAFMAAFLESISTHLDQLVLKFYLFERKEYEKVLEIAKRIKKGMPYDDIALEKSFSSIRPLEVITTDDVISKIPDIGRYTNIIHVFYRMRNEMLQFAAICEERNFLIMELIKIVPSEVPIDLIQSKYRQILDRTTKLLISGEAILDAAQFIA